MLGTHGGAPCRNELARLGDSSVAAEAGDELAGSVGPLDAAHGPRILEVALDPCALERGAIFAESFEHDDLFAWESAVGVAARMP